MITTMRSRSWSWLMIIIITIFMVMNPDHDRAHDSWSWSWSWSRSGSWSCVVDPEFILIYWASDPSQSSPRASQSSPRAPQSSPRAFQSLALPGGDSGRGQVSPSTINTQPPSCFCIRRSQIRLASIFQVTQLGSIHAANAQIHNICQCGLGFSFHAEVPSLQFVRNFAAIKWASPGSVPKRRGNPRSINYGLPVRTPHN